MPRSALIVVDVQRDFCEGGALAAADTLSLLAPLRMRIDEARGSGSVIVFTRDWHPENHNSFIRNGGFWPVHCVAGTNGAEILPALCPRAEDVVVNKGVGEEGAGYSGFEDTGLAERLKQLHVDRVGVSGIATEYCVRATALDATKAGFETAVLTDLIRAVRPEETPQVLGELQNAGVKTETAAEWIKAQR
jgi:nicotinamidase/pyrazinamidase